MLQWMPHGDGDDQRTPEIEIREGDMDRQRDIKVQLYEDGGGSTERSSVRIYRGSSRLRPPPHFLRRTDAVTHGHGS